MSTPVDPEAMSLDLTPETVDWLEAASVEEGRSVQEIIESALESLRLSKERGVFPRSMSRRKIITEEGEDDGVHYHHTSERPAAEDNPLLSQLHSDARLRLLQGEKATPQGIVNKIIAAQQQEESERRDLLKQAHVVLATWVGPGDDVESALLRLSILKRATASLMRELHFVEVDGAMDGLMEGGELHIPGRVKSILKKRHRSSFLAPVGDDTDLDF